jgi:hypothetical protein
MDTLCSLHNVSTSPLQAAATPAHNAASTAAATPQSLLDIILPGISGSMDPHMLWFQKNCADSKKQSGAMPLAPPLHNVCDDPLPTMSPVCFLGNSNAACRLVVVHISECTEHPPSLCRSCTLDVVMQTVQLLRIGCAMQQLPTSQVLPLSMSSSLRSGQSCVFLPACSQAHLLGSHSAELAASWPMSSHGFGGLRAQCGRAAVPATPTEVLLFVGHQCPLAWSRVDHCKLCAIDNMLHRCAISACLPGFDAYACFHAVASLCPL